MGFPTLSGGTAPTGAGNSGFPQLGEGSSPGTLPGTGFSPLRLELIQDSLDPQASNRAPSVRAVVQGLADLEAELRADLSGGALLQNSLSPSSTTKAPTVAAVLNALGNITSTTNLSGAATPGGVWIYSDTGADWLIPLADATNAGVQSPEHFTKLEGIEAGAQVNDVTSVAGRTGAITLAASDVSGLAAVATSGAYADLSGRPSLATVATTGAYADLTGKPTIRPGDDPLAAQVFGG